LQEELVIFREACLLNFPAKINKIALLGPSHFSFLQVLPEASEDLMD
jgi:hypothetical protein